MGLWRALLTVVKQETSHAEVMLKVLLLYLSSSLVCSCSRSMLSLNQIEFSSSRKYGIWLQHKVLWKVYNRLSSKMFWKRKRTWCISIKYSLFNRVIDQCSKRSMDKDVDFLSQDHVYPRNYRLYVPYNTIKTIYSIVWDELMPSWILC